MRLIGSLWPEGTAQQVHQQHNIEPDEVDDVLTRQPHVRCVEETHRPGEHVYAAFGQTEAGRYLMILFVSTPDEQAHILWARDMRRAERQRYEQT